MKKVILTLALSFFALGINADNNEVNNIELTYSCMDDAWDFGTRAANVVGGENTEMGAQVAYAATDSYYKVHCL